MVMGKKIGVITIKVALGLMGLIFLWCSFCLAMLNGIDDPYVSLAWILFLFIVGLGLLLLPWKAHLIKSISKFFLMILVIESRWRRKYS